MINLFKVPRIKISHFIKARHLLETAKWDWSFKAQIDWCQLLCTVQEHLFIFMSHFHHLRWIPKVCCWFWLCVDFGFAQSFYYVVVVSILNVTTGWTGWPHSYNALLESNQHQSHFHDIGLYFLYSLQHHTDIGRILIRPNNFFFHIQSLVLIPHMTSVTAPSSAI